MWQRLKHIVHDLRAYRYLSPDLKLRRQVLQFLRQRPLLSPADWHAIYGNPLDLSLVVIKFAHDYLGQYSGLEFGRTRPDDHLEDDLYWTHICWFDWTLSLCDDFQTEFGIDLSGELSNLPITTVGALLRFLERHWEAPESLSTGQKPENP
jgi:hypothetical protein